MEFSSAEDETFPSPEDLPSLLSPAIPVLPSSSSSHPKPFRHVVTVITDCPSRQAAIAAVSSGPCADEDISLTHGRLVIKVDDVDIVNHITHHCRGVIHTPHDLGMLTVSGSDPPFSEIWRSPEIMHSFITSRK
jgi:hypothetical protein